MSSLKALMSKKKAEARLSHPYARYSSSNQLTCSICGLVIKHANLWSGHLLSKGHRQKERDHLKKAEEAQESSKKRKREEEDGHGEGGEDGGKRKRDDDDNEEEDGNEDAGGSSLPADFFADPSMAPSKRAATPDEEDAEAQVPVVGEEDDDEWAAFEASLADRPPAVVSTANATIFAEPILYEFGAPVVKEEGEEGDEAEEEEEEAETEEEKQERLEREEREEIMERIMEETRLQQEADDKVDALKKKLELIRQNRKKKA